VRPLTSFFKFIVFLAAFYFLSSSSAQTQLVEDKPARRCIRCVETRFERLPRYLRILEDQYLRYRSNEAKIRRLFYDHVWRARIAASDPLSKEQRKSGQAEDERLEQWLRRFEKDSTAAANSLVEMIHRLETMPGRLAACEPNASLAICQSPHWREILDNLDALEKHFEHVFEHEREYREAVELTAGSRKGLYPQDSLEKPVAHGDYYARFEEERASARFQEDARTMELILNLGFQFQDQAPFTNCCLEITEVQNFEVDASL